MTHMQWAGGIGRNEFQRDTVIRVGLKVTKSTVFSQSVLYRAGKGQLVHEEIDESRACDFRAFNLAGTGKSINDGLREFRWWHSYLFGQHKRQVGCELAMLGGAGSFQLRHDLKIDRQQLVPLQVKHCLDQQFQYMFFPNPFSSLSRRHRFKAGYCKPLCRN
jgi:hypothetical protein